MSLSAITRMLSNPCDFRSGLTKSIAISVNQFSETSNGCNNPASACVGDLLQAHKS